jgi:flagellar biosynthetic protein FlhB
MAEESHGARTEEPTAKRLRDARRKGQVAQSRDLTTAAALLAAVGALVFSAGHLAGEVTAFFARALAIAADPENVSAGAILWDGVSAGLFAILPMLGAVVLLPGVVSFLQVGALFSTDPITPKLERLSPAAGLKRLFSLHAFVETAKAAVKLAGVGALAWAIGKEAARDLAQTPIAPVGTTASLAAGLAARVGAVVAIAFAALAVLDLLYQRWRHRRDLRMTRWEVKREHRETEGDPQHRAQRQRLHREILTHNMLEDVRKATVIVVNPEHIAVALVYEKDGEGAPRVVAKGERVLAQQILEIAREAGVPVVRNVPLAHALHRLEIGEEIPEELYEAVAEVLQFVYRLSEEGW